MTVTVGGPPRGAEVLHSVTVLRGTSAADWTPTLPGAAWVLGQPDKDGLCKPRRDRALWANVGGRLALADYLAAREDDRVISVHRLPDGLHVHVYDGRGRLVEDITGGGTDLDTATVLARAEWHRLREDARATPWRWEPLR